MSFHWILCRLTMSKEDRQGFIVKFVEYKGQKTEYSVKAYKVYRNPLSNNNVDSADCLMSVMFTQAILELQSEKYVKTVDEDALLQMDQKDKSLYVFNSFTGPAFLHCKTVWLNAASPIIITRSFRKVIYYFVTFSMWCSLVAGWWVHWWCCSACSSSIVFPKQRSPSITWPWLMWQFPAQAWIKQHGLVFI